MFDFRIIDTAEGDQIIDTSLKTPYDSLTLSEMVEYIETDKQVAYMDKLKRKKRKAAERQRNLLYKIIYFLWNCVEAML